MREPAGFMEFGKKHSKVHLDAPGLCPLCLERYIDAREGGAETPLVEEVVDGVKTGKWICPDGGRSYSNVLEAGHRRYGRHPGSCRVAHHSPPSKENQGRPPKTLPA